jgi:hypothetical protein
MGHDRRHGHAVFGEPVERRRDELEQPLGDPPLQIEEEEIVDERLVRDDLPRERPEHCGGGRRLGREELDERLPRRGPHRGLVEREGGRRPRDPAENAELAKELRFVERRVQHPLPARRERRHLDPPLDEEQHLGGRVSLLKEIGAPAVPAHRARLHQPANGWG